MIVGLYMEIFPNGVTGPRAPEPAVRGSGKGNSLNRHSHSLYRLHIKECSDILTLFLWA